MRETVKHINPWRVTAALAALFLLVFIAALVTTLSLLLAEPSLQKPQPTGIATGTNPALSVTIKVPHQLIRTLPEAIEDAARQRHWQISEISRATVLTLPATDMPLLQETNHGPDAFLNGLAAAPVPPPGAVGPEVHVQVRWQIEHSPAVNAATMAIFPSLAAAVTLGMMYLAGSWVWTSTAQLQKTNPERRG